MQCPVTVAVVCATRLECCSALGCKACEPHPPCALPQASGMFWNCFKQQAPERTVTTQETLEYLFSCTTFFDKYRETRNCLVSQQPALPVHTHSHTLLIPCPLLFYAEP